MAEYRSLIPFGRRGLLRGGFDPFTSFRDEMDKLLEDFGQSLPSTDDAKGAFLVPKVDVAETSAGLELTAELPGFEEKDVSLDIHEGVLTIKAEHSEERKEEDKDKKYHLVERRQGSFLRRFALPFEADADKAEAHLENGLLKVSVPRLTVPEKQPKTIPVGKKQ